MSRRKRNQIDGQFNARLIEMMESPAYRVLSLSARRVLDRICIELAHHGGNDNGKLPVTYEQFMEYGIDRHTIAPALRELVALGFIEITVKGRHSAGDVRWPNLFRLTCVNCKSTPNPSHEWRRIKTMGEARAIAQVARAAKDARVVQKAKTASRKNRTHGGETPTVTVGETHPREADSHGGETPTTSLGGEIHPTSISRVKAPSLVGGANAQ
jgi:hypothetical protein